MQNNMKRNIGAFALTMTGIGSIIGSGWLFGAWKAAKLAGPAAIYAWIIGTILILFIGLSFAELGGMFPEAGGMVRYGQFSHGSLVGYLSGWANWIAIVSVIPVEAEASTQYISSWPFEWAHSLYDGKELTITGLFISALLVIVYFLLNYFTVSLFARVNTVITIFKFVIPACVIIGLIVTSFNGQNFTHYGGFMPNGWSGVLTAVSISGIVFSFNGFQSPINMAGEAKNPNRNVPLAVVLSILIAGVIYLLLQVTFTGGVTPDMLKHGWANINLNSPFADLAMAWGLNWLVLLLFADAVVSPSGTGVTYTATTARMIYGMNQNGYFPSIFGKVDKKSGIPRPAMWFNIFVSFIFLLLFRGWGQLSSIISIATLISYMTGPVSVMVFRRHREYLKSPLKIKGMPIIAPLGFIASALIFYWGSWPLTGKVTMIIIIGLPVYFYYQYKNDFAGFKRDFKAGLWFIFFLIWMIFISYIGSEKFGGLNIIPFGWDFLVIGVSALIFYFWGVRSGWVTEALKRGNEQNDSTAPKNN
ncbi:amino acid transporter [Scopulibacillus daqui]|uniref:Amino acid transporter n=1 Tax=Scopulibacillus daqui TaxID=1469162 RepID=A0ABS2PUV4_9BACL|nr:APC family permease [Scopulibacillus daqui]MBM7643839.1 amino acid transporter [Scopulibacillus daqui]